MMFTLKYRPQSLSEMVGQEHIIKEMKKRSSMMAFPQNMLFSGPTGTGKTSMCYIISALINCSNPKREVDILGNEFFNPCLKCESCISVKGQRFSRDIYVYNASKLGKAEVERIDDQTCFMPLYDKHKIVVIEEFQEFYSKKSYGSFYTLLEEPKKNVYFLLICMDTSSVPKAIQHRCVHYEFLPVSVPAVYTHLYRVLEKERLASKVPDHFISKGLLKLAENANGDVRKAVQDLEKCIYGEIYSLASIEMKLGYNSA